LNIGAQSLFDLYVPNNGTVSEFPFKLITEIKSYDDFIGRYNGELNIYGEKINFSNNITRLDSISILRTKIIGSLVTQAYLQSNYDKVLEFSTMAGNGPKLDFSKTKCEALVPIKGVFQKNNITAVLHLNIETLSGNRYRWFIRDILFSPNIGKIKHKAVLPEICLNVFIPPNSHEVGFLALRRLLNGEELLQNHIIKSNSNLEKLNFLLENGWKPKYIEYEFKISVNSDLIFMINSEYKITKIL